MAIHFKLLLVLALCTISASGDLLWSIDCGTPFTTSAYGSNSIVWEGDSDLFKKGTSVHTVQTSNSISDVMNTLRVFNNAQKKNCYDFTFSNTEYGGTLILVRASFNYGNYDKKSSPPTFDLLFDANFWTTVETSNTGVVYHEVVYVVKTDHFSVCLVQTKPNQIPFISALEVRSLDSEMYGKVDSSVALFLYNRVAYGASAPIRFADDYSDRIWEPAKIEDGQVKVTSDISISTDADVDNPPQSVLQNAVKTVSTSKPLILDMGLLPLPTSQAYINWYFSELTELDTTQKRSFEIFVNNRSISDPILPPYESVEKLSLTNYSIPSGATFSLVATTDSDLPPIINAMEVFTISDVLIKGTNIDDIEGLASLQRAFVDDLNAWGGDPCLPSRFAWEWVSCSADDIPRITAINLKGFGLEGEIPDFSSMDALETINLQNNKLVGPIPDFLGDLPKLKKLNVADNKLSGPIPTSLSINNKLDLTWTGNPSLCKSGCELDPTTPPSGDGNPPTRRSSKKSKTGVIVGTTIPLFIVFWAIVGAIIVVRKRRAAAVSAAIASGNRSNGKPQGENGNGINLEMAGEALKNEFSANVDPSGDQTGNHPHQQV